MPNTRGSRLLLIVEPEAAQRRYLSSLAARGAWRSITVATAAEAMTALGSKDGSTCEVLLADDSQVMADGVSLVDAVQRTRRDLPIIVTASQNGLAVAIDAMKRGAVDFLMKPIASDRLLAALDNAASDQDAASEMRPMSEKLRSPLAFEEVIGSTPSFRSALAIAAKAARARVPVLIEGADGVGKEVFARAVHQASSRSKAPLILFDCSSVAPGLIGSGLFGHEQGAFPGAFERQSGNLLASEGGSIIIDHVECMPPETQARLMQFIHSGEVVPIGRTQGHPVDVRIIATTSVPLQRLIAEGHFREDLFYALSTAHLTIPPLTERRGDIPALVRHFLTRFAALPGMRGRGITDGALELIDKFEWPGNVRQLQDALFRASLANDGEVLTTDDFPGLEALVLDGPRQPVGDGNVHGTGIGVTLYQADGHLRPLQDIEADVIRLAIGHYRGRMSEVARRLGIGRSTLYRKLADLGIDTSSTAA